MEDQPEVFWAVIISMYLGNIVLLILNLPLIPYIAKLLTVPRYYLIPFVIFFSLIGAYIGQNNATELLIMIGGLHGYDTEIWGFPLPPLILVFWAECSKTISGEPCVRLVGWSLCGNAQ